MNQEFIGFSEVTTSNLRVKSIQPSARFLFVSLKRLIIEEMPYLPDPYEHLTSMVELFQESSIKLEFVKHGFSGFSDLPDELKKLTTFPIKSLELVEEDCNVDGEEDDEDFQLRMTMYANNAGAAFKD
jgi:hypothetical protein